MASTKSKKTKKSEEAEDESAESEATNRLIERIKQLQAEYKSLELEVTRQRGVPSQRISVGKVGVAFVAFGALSLIFSVYRDSSVLAFIGLGLTFWGALFFFVRPSRYVRSSLLDAAAVSSYSTIDRILRDLKYEGTGYYVPPPPGDVRLPDYLKGLKDMIVFISADKDTGMPTIEEMAESKFLLKSPKGICVTPPGLGLLTQLENELKRDLTKLDINELCEIIPKLVLENFELAKEVEMQPKDDEIYLKIVDPINKSLYSREENLKSVHLLGSPLVSAIACALAKTTAKIITIQKDEVSPDGQTIQTWYHTVEG